MSEYPTDIIEKASDVAGIISDLFDAETSDCFSLAIMEIAAAILAERNNWKDVAEETAADAFTMGMDAERLRTIEIVKSWATRLNGSEYLSRQIEALLAAIITPSRTIQYAEFSGKTIIAHPNVPPHIWDGKEMKRIEFEAGS